MHCSRVREADSGQKSGFITGLLTALGLGRNLITLLIWEISLKLEDIFCFK